MLQTDDVEMDGGTLGAHMSTPMIDLTPLTEHQTAASSLASQHKKSTEKEIASLQKWFQAAASYSPLAFWKKLAF